MHMILLGLGALFSRLKEGCSLVNPVRSAYKLVGVDVFYYRFTSKMAMCQGLQCNFKGPNNMYLYLWFFHLWNLDVNGSFIFVFVFTAKTTKVSPCFLLISLHSHSHTLMTDTISSYSSPQRITKRSKSLLKLGGREQVTQSLIFFFGGGQDILPF